MGKENTFEAELAAQKQQLITEQITGILAPGVTVETAVEALDMDPERLLSHLEAVTAEGQSPWLKGNVLALQPLWQQENVGLVVCDEKAFREGTYTNYRPPREFRIEEPRAIPENVLSDVRLKNAAFALASSIGAFAQEEPFDDVAVQLLTGCSRDVMKHVPRFVSEQGYAKAVPQEMRFGYRIKDVSPRLYGADIPQ
jgi:hypothetical protein